MMKMQINLILVFFSYLIRYTTKIDKFIFYFINILSKIKICWLKDKMKKTQLIKNIQRWEFYKFNSAENNTWNINN